MKTTLPLEHSTGLAVQHQAEPGRSPAPAGAYDTRQGPTPYARQVSGFRADLGLCSALACATLFVFPISGVARKEAWETLNELPADGTISNVGQNLSFELDAKRDSHCSYKEWIAGSKLLP